MKRKVIKMAVRTNFELFDFITSGYDLSISATDKDGNTQTVSSTDNTKRYFYTSMELESIRCLPDEFSNPRRWQW